MTDAPTIHASAVLIGAKAALIRGPAGSGKSRLVWSVLQAAQSGAFPYARLVSDDRVHVEARHGRLLVRPAAKLAGLLEIRGVGILHLPHEALAAVGWIVDLGVPEAERLPPEAAAKAVLQGIELPRLAVAPGAEPVPLLLGFTQLRRVH